jgi:glutaredoxin-dependent peroxiredoxin
MSLKVGDKAPVFALISTDKKEVKLEDFKGKNVLILFFPFAFTSTCTKELCSVRDEIAAYNSIGCEVLALSVDSPYTLAKYKEEQGLNFTLLSDFNKEVSTAYYSLYEIFGTAKMRGVSKRSAFVVDKSGIIRYAEVLENAGEIPNLIAIKKLLSELN